MSARAQGRSATGTGSERRCRVGARQVWAVDEVVGRRRLRRARSLEPKAGCRRTEGSWQDEMDEEMDEAFLNQEW
jgi:hypothetical protein